MGSPPRLDCQRPDEGRGYWNEEHDRPYVGLQAEGVDPAQILRFEAEDY